MTTFRLARTIDLTEIVNIAQASTALLNAEGNFQWSKVYPTKTHFEQDISDGTLWVAMVGDNVAGFVALTTDQPIDYGNVGWDVSEKCIVPHRLAVSPQFRGLGIAQELMKVGETLAKQLGYKYVRVDTNEVNKKVQGIFLKLGYVFAGRTILSGKPENMYSYCYSKEVVW